MEQLEKEETQTSVSKILQYLISYRDTNVFALARKTGIPQPTILKIIRGQTKNPGIYTMERLAEGLELPPSVFFGDSFEINQADFKEKLQVLSESRNNNPRVKSNSVIPLYSWDDVKFNPKACITRTNKRVIDWYNFPVKKANSNIFCLKIESDYYLPEFSRGDLIFIDPDKRYENGSILLIRQQYNTINEDQIYKLYISQEIKEPEEVDIEFSLFLKKIGFKDMKPCFYSLSPDALNEKIDDDISIIGVVVGRFSIYK